MHELPANSENFRSSRLRQQLEETRKNPAGLPPPDRRCQGITRNGNRCTAWTITGDTYCAGHAGISLEAARAARAEAAQRRAEARLSVRERAAAALDDDFPAVLNALRRGIAQPDPAKAAKAAADYVSLVYGRQLQRPDDEKPSTSELDVSQMTRAERDELKRQLLAGRPELAARVGLELVDVAETGDAATETA